MLYVEQKQWILVAGFLIGYEACISGWSGCTQQLPSPRSLFFLLHVGNKKCCVNCCYTESLFSGPSWDLVFPKSFLFRSLTPFCQSQVVSLPRISFWMMECVMNLQRYNTLSGGLWSMRITTFTEWGILRQHIAVIELILNKSGRGATVQGKECKIKWYLFRSLP